MKISSSLYRESYCKSLAAPVTSTRNEKSGMPIWSLPIKVESFDYREGKIVDLLINSLQQSTFSCFE